MNKAFENLHIPDEQRHVSKHMMEKNGFQFLCYDYESRVRLRLHSGGEIAILPDGSIEELGETE